MMKLYSDSLTGSDIRNAVASVPGVLVDSLLALKSPRLRERGWEIKLTRPSSRRHFNTGNYGAGEQGAASWDDYGRFLAALFDADPSARLGYYEGRERFHEMTGGKYKG